MVRRLLLTALLATLAVALPAAAEEDPAFGPPSGSDPSGCLPSDLVCGDVQSATLGPSQYGSNHCRAWDLNLPDGNQPLLDTFIADPDGCIRSLVWRTLEDLPPGPVAIYTSTLPSVEALFPWP